MIHRSLLAATALTLWLGSSPLGALAQSSDFVNGQVTRIDESAQKITIKHGPLKKFDMEDGMTMVFRAQDPAMLKTVKPGDKIKFVPERINGQFTATKIEKTK
jgi:Cu(I)/Ag(I) efflux system periplasmic protein CusF